MAEASISEYNKFFVVTKLDSSTIDTIFYPIFKRLIATNLIILLKTYKQFLDGKEYILNIIGNRYYNFKNRYFNTLKLISNPFYQQINAPDYFTKLKNEIIAKYGEEILKNFTDEIVDGIYFGDNSEEEKDIRITNFDNLLQILYFLLDYEKIIEFNEFKIKIIKYIDSLYNSDLSFSSEGYIIPKEEDKNNIKQFILLTDLINTYNESLNLYNNDYVKTTSCNINYVEFNDINKINEITQQLLSVFVFVSDKPSSSGHLIAKHFFIIKDIINHILYEINIKSNAIAYSSIILHSYCAYHFSESFFITNPKPNMAEIFNKHIGKYKTITILSNFRLLLDRSEKSNDNDDDEKIYIFIKDLYHIDLTKLVEDIKYLISCCKFRSDYIYDGHMLFNVINFRNDWKNLIDIYLKPKNVTKGGSKKKTKKRVKKIKISKKRVINKYKNYNKL